MTGEPSTQISDPLDRSSNPINPEPFVEGKLRQDPRPGDEDLEPMPMDQDPETDPRKVRTLTDDGEMSPDDPR